MLLRTERGTSVVHVFPSIIYLIDKYCSSFVTHAYKCKIKKQMLRAQM